MVTFILIFSGATTPSRVFVWLTESMKRKRQFITELNDVETDRWWFDAILLRFMRYDFSLYKHKQRTHKDFSLAFSANICVYVHSARLNDELYLK